MISYTTIALCALLFSSKLALAQQSHAPLPRTLSYQGVLTASGAGIKAAGSRLLTVTLYGDANGTIKLWQSTMNTTVDSSGVFNCLLGSADNPLPNAPAMDRPIWLGVAVDNGPELRPLSQVTASAYALNVVDNAITTAKLADSSVTTAKLANRSVTWNKMGTEYVPYIRVNGAKVTTGQNSINFTGGDGLRVDYDSNSMSVIIHPDSGGELTNKGGVMKPMFVGGNPASSNSDNGYAGSGNHNNSTNTVGGGTNNTAYGGIAGDTNGHATIAGGEENLAEDTLATIGGGKSNTAAAYESTIGGGASNVIIDTEPIGTIAGGFGNHIDRNPYGKKSFGKGNFIGGGGDNDIGMNDEETTPDSGYEVIAGGEYDTTHESFAFVGGGSFNVGDEEWSTIGGGDTNQSWGEFGTVGGGEHNWISSLDDYLANRGGPGWDFIGGGLDNFILEEKASIVGGESNMINVGSNYGFIGGGKQDTLAANSTGSVIGGGTHNTVAGTYSAIPGGQNLTIGGYSFGFNASTASTDISSYSNAAYFGNVDLWIGNVDNTARTLRFYSPNNATDYSSATYSSFQATAQPQGNILYTLPDSLPLAGEVLKAASIGVSTVTLKWGTETGSSGGLAGWLLQGNLGVPPPANYLGTQDSEAFEIHIHNNTTDTTGGNRRVMRYSEGPTSPNILGGSSFDSLTPGLSGAAILSGGSKLAPNIVSDTFSVIAGGRGNLIQGPFSVIAGGDSNQITASGADHNFIGGGYNNIEANPSFGVIAGGAYNYLGYSAYSSAIGGGWYDTIAADAYSAFLGAGELNKIDGYSDHSVLGGGERNHIGGGDHSVVVGGYGNDAFGRFSTLGGGRIDSIHATYSFLGGGDSNKIDWGSDTSVLVGGAKNFVSGRYSFLGGGLSDTIGSPFAILGGGQGNKIDANSDHSVIAGGDTNNVTNGPRAFVGGGCFNSALAKWGTIVGGCGNKVTDALTFIGGGQDNMIAARLGTVGGGELNQIQTIPGDTTKPLLGTIGGGLGNTIGPLNPVYLNPLPSGYNLPYAPTIAGGVYDTASGHFSSVVGGWFNRAIGKYSAVVGGRGLLAQDYQTVVGRYNDTNTLGGGLNNWGTPFTSPLPIGVSVSGAETLLNPNAPTFIVGNGGIEAGPGHTIVEYRSNAFAVSDDGHSNVFQTLGNYNSGTPQATTPAVGGTYVDNTILAWGDVPAAAGTPVASLGVVSVTHLAPGTYLVKLVAQNFLDHNIIPTHASITVTLRNNDTSGFYKYDTVASPPLIFAPDAGQVVDTTALCGHVDATEIGLFAAPWQYSFIVHTRPLTDCGPEDRAFFFKVCGR